MSAVKACGLSRIEHTYTLFVAALTNCSDLKGYDQSMRRDGSSRRSIARLCSRAVGSTRFRTYRSMSSGFVADTWCTWMRLSDGLFMYTWYTNGSAVSLVGLVLKAPNRCASSIVGVVFRRAYQPPPPSRNIRLFGSPCLYSAVSGEQMYGTFIWTKPHDVLATRVSWTSAWAYSSLRWEGCRGGGCDAAIWSRSVADAGEGGGSSAPPSPPTRSVSANQLYSVPFLVMLKFRVIVATCSASFQPIHG
mmetsp:Transcript_33082/g.79018  ORF Transcript_33082/g.79018 Transcript_33082/m.79018 type:complete len:248 (+) Transcript_33082:2038-2781(+)